MLSDLKFNPNNLIEILVINFFSQLVRWLFYVSKYLIDSFRNIKVFLGRNNYNKIVTKFLFYCFLPFYFIVNISVTMIIFTNFYCKFIVMKI